MAAVRVRDLVVSYARKRGPGDIGGGERRRLDFKPDLGHVLKATQNHYAMARRKSSSDYHSFMHSFSLSRDTAKGVGLCK